MRFQSLTIGQDRQILTLLRLHGRIARLPCRAKSPEALAYLPSVLDPVETVAPPDPFVIRRSQTTEVLDPVETVALPPYSSRSPDLDPVEHVRTGSS